MEIRRAVDGDSPCVATLLGELGYPTSSVQVARRIARHCESETDPAWVATGDPGRSSGTGLSGFVAGHAFWPYELDRPVAELTALVVAPADRGRGVGTLLVRTVEDWATGLGCQRISVASSLQRVEAHAFYGRLGYQQLAKKFEKSL